MYLTGLGTAVPCSRYTQAQCWTALQEAPQFPHLKPRSQAVLRKVLTGENGIDTRHLAVRELPEAFDLTPDALSRRFEEHAPALATQAAERAMANARIPPAAVDAVLVSTCTGTLCPGLTSYVSERLGLRADVQALDLVGQGCGAALPNCRTAEAFVSSGRARHVLSVCVEICSAAFYLDNDPGVLISACLFGDGAAAAVWSRQSADHARRVEWMAADTLHSPRDRDALRFETRTGMLRNILTRGVPTLASQQVDRLLRIMLQRYPLERDEVTAWILHAGGREVLSKLQSQLALSDTDLLHSTAILSEHGNVSSPFVLFALDRALTEDAPGGWWWMSSFGAGFSCHGAFLKVE